jgi:glutathione S-transferase
MIEDRFCPQASLASTQSSTRLCQLGRRTSGRTAAQQKEILTMKHYYHPKSRAVTTDWMLRELDVPHERIVIDFTKGDQDTAEFRALNPMGKIPTLVDGATVVTESAAICAYLADRFPEKRMAPSPGSNDRGRYYRYLFFPGTTLEPLLSVNALGLKSYSGASMGFGDMQRGMAAVEAMTPSTEWILGADFTAADVVFGGTLAFFREFGLLKTTEKVDAYVHRIQSRPAFQASHRAD